MLARTLLQPAQVISFGFKIVAWLAPLVRARERLARAPAPRRSAPVRRRGRHARVARRQGPGRRARGSPRCSAWRAGDGAWHVQRDDWVALGCEVAVLCGSLGKIGRDLALLAQAEVGEVAEPAGAGRGGSSAMPQKRNPVAAMTAIAAAVARAASRGGAARGDGARRTSAASATGRPSSPSGRRCSSRRTARWPPWPTPARGLDVDAARMRDNIERQRGTVFAEAAAALLVPSLGKAKAHELLATLSARAMSEGADLQRAAARRRRTPPPSTPPRSTRRSTSTPRRAAPAPSRRAQLDRLAPPSPRTGTAP